MLSTPPLFQTEPAGKPAADVGIFIMDRLFTNVVQVLSAAIFEPTINVQALPQILLHSPPKTTEYKASAILRKPLPTYEKSPLETLHLPLFMVA